MIRNEDEHKKLLERCKIENHKEKEDDLLEEISESIRTLLKGEKEKRKDIAKYLGLSESNFNKKLNRTDPRYSFSFYEILHIGKYFRMSIEELVYGVKREDFVSHDNTKLNRYSIEWLKRIREESPNVAQTVDIVLENKAIANSLFNLLYLYSTSSIYDVDLPYAKRTDNRFNSFIKDDKLYLRYLLEHCIMDVFEQVKEEYAKLPKREREQTSPAEMYETLHNIRQALAENWSSIQTELSKEEIGVFEKVIHKLIDIYGTSEEQENLADDNNGFPILKF